MHLIEKTKAPDFTTEDIFGNPTKLSDYHDKKLMICFFRYAGCPFCNLSVFRLISHYPQLQAKGLNVLVFFQSPKENIIKYVSKHQSPFPLIADPRKIIYNQYGVESSKVKSAMSITQLPRFAEAVIKYRFPQGVIDGDAFLMPAYFLIGPHQTLEKVRYGKSFADEMPLIDIQEFLLF